MTEPKGWENEPGDLGPLGGYGTADRAPVFAPFIVTISWVVGDSLQVDCGELEGWEVIALLQQAEEVIRDADQADAAAAAEGEDAEA